MGLKKIYKEMEGDGFVEKMQYLIIYFIEYLSYSSVCLTIGLIFIFCAFVFPINKRFVESVREGWMKK